MEAALGKSVHGDEVKKEMKAASSDEQGCQEEFLFKKANMTKVETPSAELELRGFSPAQKQQEDPLASAKAEMGEMIQENQRLRMHLDRIMKDYRTLEMQFQDIVHQEATKSASTINTHEHDTEEPDFVSLSLGRTLNDAKKDETCKIVSKEEVDEEDKGGLAHGLDCNYHEMPKKEAVESSIISPENSVEEVKQEAEQTWSPNNMLKRSNGDDGILQQNSTKRARVSLRVRCDTTTMNDGCQWRKYGQKIAKGNPCPRAYYRCTVVPNCPVRKQVQRCAEDMSILITTYEGTHNHPLPFAATAMASTTSAAASMLLSGSSSSSSGPNNINGLNFYLSDNSKSKPFYLQNSSSISSSSPACPTITLDLTSSSSSSLSTLNKIGAIPPPTYSSTNLNFNFFENSPPISWSNGVFNYGATTFNKNQVSSLSFGRQTQENLRQSYLQKNVMNSTQTPLPPHTIAAATKAITSDPSFQSALAVALSSIIGPTNGDFGTLGNQVLANSKPG